jgi:BirA family biotin operon repressor/biotin-[acetyl-CoA-carboxylase] ligase
MVQATSVPGVRAKWPNDLMAGDRKLGGILGEARVSGGSVDHVVLGAGVNVDMRKDNFPPELRTTATSLALEGSALDDSALLERFLTTLRSAWPPDEADVVRRYLEVCDTIGRRVRATTTAGTVVEGTATGVSQGGGLLVEGQGSPKLVAFGEVTHLA